jgi:antitoxin component HigA of HigAB toxin-antitoxin module
MKAIIKTEEENKVALAFVERLMEDDPEKDSEEGKLLCLLADAIVIFEKRYDSPSLSPQSEETK